MGLKINLGKWSGVLPHSRYAREQGMLMDLRRVLDARKTDGRYARLRFVIISWHKTRIFISEVFRFEELAFELVTPDFYKVFFRDMEIGELNVEELRFRAARRVV